MRLLIALLLTLYGAGSLDAETAKVRSVNLGNITRVAIEFEVRPEWRAERTEDGYAVLVSNDDALSLDTATSLGQDTTGRVASIRLNGTGNGVEIVLGCDCRAQIYEFRNTSIVLDIGEAGPDRPQENRVASAASNLQSLGHSNTPLQVLGVLPFEEPLAAGIESEQGPNPHSPEDSRPQRAAPLALLKLDVADGAFRIAESGLSAIQMPFGKSSVDLEFSTLETRDSYAVEMLSRELSRAVAQGLVDAPDLSLALPRSPGVDLTGTNLHEGLSNLSITTAMDRDSGAKRIQPAPTMAGSVCLPDSEFEITSWGDPTDVVLLGHLRTDAFDENGTPSDNGMLALARHYLAKGFGAEAASLIEYIADPSRRELLRSMAEIVDHGKSDSTILAGQVFCKGKVALWSMLAYDVALSEKPSDTDYILSAFSEMPLHVRIHLGPVLSQRLRRLGFDAEAQIALNSVTRGGGHTPAQDLTAARLGLSGTAAETARGELQILSRGTDLIAAEALLELLLDAERRAVPPEPAWVDDAPSLVRATQGTETAAELNLAGLRGQIALGQFDSLRMALNEWSPGVTEDTRRDLASAAIGQAGATADEPTLLRAEVAFAKVAEPDLIPVGQRVRVAERLIALGLPDRALTYLPDMPVSDDERQLSAEALSDLQRYGEAISILSGSRSPDLLKRLGDVYLRHDRPTEAMQTFALANAPEAAVLAAIRNSDWLWLAANADESLSSATKGLQPENGPEHQGSDGGNARLLDQAALRRQKAQILLQRTEIATGQDAFTN